MSRLKAIYRSWGIPCAGKQVYATRHRSEWLEQIEKPAAPPSGDSTSSSMCCGRCARRCAAICWPKPRSMTHGNCYADSVRSALSERLADRDPADTASFPYQATALDLQRVWDGDARQRRTSILSIEKGGASKKQVSIRGLNRNHNHDLKNLFKGAATVATAKPGPFQDLYDGLVSKGIKPAMARLTLARKITAIILTVWKKGVSFDAKYLKTQTA